MTKASYYQRDLPSPPATDFASDEGEELFREAFLDRTMVGFFMLISYFQTQSEPTYCGLASLSMVLNALAIDPGRTWKGPWRWYDESMLGCRQQLQKIKAEGISFTKAVRLVQDAGAEVQPFKTSQTNVDFFRQSVKNCSSSRNCHLVSSYHRAGLQQEGAGHFSPIGGYNEKRDMVLILDVARFKYRCHWAPLHLLWEAMDTDDETTKEKRGFMLISKPKTDAGLLYTLICKNESWVGVVRYLMDEVPNLLKSEDVKDINGILRILLASPLSGVGKFIQSVAEVKREQECGIGISEEEKQRLASREDLLKQVRDTGFFKDIVNFFSSTSCCSRVPVVGGSENLHEIAAVVCCHVAETSGGKSSTSGCSCCHETCVKCMIADGHKTVTVRTATIVKGKNEEKVNMPVPQSLMKPCSGAPDPNNCTSTQPVGNDILTVLLLMLPPKTWCSIKDEKLREEVRTLVSMDNLSPMLRREVLHLRRQVYDPKKCQENMVKKKSVNMVKKKSAFAQKEVPFLGQGGRVQMDKANMCSLTMLLMDMLKKKKPLEWTGQCQKAFDQLKQFMTKSYEVETDVSDYAIGGVFMQDKHLVAFESQKLNNAEQRYTVQGKVVPTRPRESVFMTFIMNLPKSKGYQTLMVVVDRFSKHAIFMPATEDCSAEEAVKLFLKHVVPYWGVPQTIVSDRDVQIMKPLWIKLFKLLGSKLNFSISPHPQTNSQTEMVNVLLEIYFRHFVTTKQANWAELIDVAQFSYNSQFTSKSLFEITIGEQPQTPSAVALGYQGDIPSAYKFIKDWQEQVVLVQARLHEALEHMIKWIDKKGWHVEFQVGDLVYVKLHETSHYKDMQKNSNWYYFGPFHVLQRVGKVAYELALLPNFKLHPVFHVSMLKHKKDLDRGESQRASCDDPSTSQIR